MNLSTPVTELPRVGPAYQRKLKRLGIKNIGQLIFHFPHRYEDFSNLIPIAKTEEGGPFCIQGKITDIRCFRAFKRKMMLTQATIEDDTGKIKALWFNQPYLINTLEKGTFICLAGKIKGKKSSKYLSSPVYEKIGNWKLEIDNSDLTHTGRLIPIYPETEGLSSKWLRFIVKPLLEKLKNKIPDSLPEKIKEKYNFLPIEKAIWQIHFPDSLELAREAEKRFSFEELFILSLFVLRERMKLAKENATAIPININLMKKFTENLPFTLTNAQKKCSWQILKDMEKSQPMNRLLEGDVGSGKTVVATMAALNTAKAGHQTAFLAPTEILAKQHNKTINKILKKFNLNIGLITGKESYLNDKKIPRKELLEKIKNGDTKILIGTHAIIQDTNPLTSKKTPVIFNDLALVIIDEQHRFGVEQRAKLFGQKEFIPHLLSMSATPIPRTLSLTIYGDLDLSIIDELPKGRKKIITKIIKPKEKKETYEFIRKEVKKGHKIFVICPRIDPPARIATPARSRYSVSGGQSVAGGAQNLILDERKLSWMDVKAVKQEYEKLSKNVFPDLKIAMLHGKMKTQEKEKAMKDFKDGKTEILVSTSVVEVGVDIQNATVIMIEGSEKFGLAQLHQFRGRVGRSDFQSYCFLFTDTEGVIYSERHAARYMTRPATYNKRLNALVNCDNGFELAEKDLQIRGPGDFVGLRQWGIPDIAMASLNDVISVQNARQEAKKILEEDPELKKYPLLKEKLLKFRERIHLE